LCQKEKFTAVLNVMPSHLSGRKNTNGKSNNHNDTFYHGMERARGWMKN
jgi:hypothetical protein